MHCVCALVRMAGAGCLAVLDSLSLPAPTPLLPLGAGGRGACVPPGWGLYLIPFAWRWFLTGVDVVLSPLVSILGRVVFVIFS